MIAAFFWIIITVLFLIIFAGIGGIFYYFHYRQKNAKTQEGGQSFLMLQGQLQAIEEKIDKRLSDSSTIMQTQLKQSSEVAQDYAKNIVALTEKLTELKETNRQVINFTEQLQSLQDMLKNPKQRGILGEYYLETVLKNVLPPGTYQMQYRMGTDEKTGKELIADAVVFVKDKIIPIDSKFSLENYQRLNEERDPVERERLERLLKNDLKMRIDETSKYIQPEKGTMDFAFMFIPHEAIYYDLLVAQIGAVKVNTRDLLEYAFKEKRVIIISPTSFHAYLQTVLQGLRAFQIEESAKEIIIRVQELSKHLLAYDEYMQKLGKNIGLSVGSYNEAYREFKKIDKDVVRIGAEGGAIEALALEKPDKFDNADGD